MLWLAKASSELCVSLPTYEYQNNMWYGSNVNINLFEKALNVPEIITEGPHIWDG